MDCTKGPWRASLQARSQADLWLSGQDKGVLSRLPLS